MVRETTLEEVKYKLKNGIDEETYHRLPDNKGAILVGQKSETNEEDLLIFFEKEEDMKQWIEETH